MNTSFRALTAQRPRWTLAILVTVFAALAIYLLIRVLGTAVTFAFELGLLLAFRMDTPATYWLSLTIYVMVLLVLAAFLYTRSASRRSGGNNAHFLVHCDDKSALSSAAGQDDLRAQFFGPLPTWFWLAVIVGACLSLVSTLWSVGAWVR